MTFEPDKPRTIYCATFALITFIALWQILADSTESPLLDFSFTLNSANSSYSYPVYKLPATDYGRLIDLNFTFNILNPVCNESNPLVIILVHSSPKNYRKREVIRNTWGRPVKNIKLLFVLGSVVSAQQQNDLERENEKFNDLIQGSFLDTYRNLTYKHVMVLKYAIYHCPQARYILKTDDDVFVNTQQLRNFLMNDLSPYGGSKMLFCMSRKNSIVVRSYRSKWRVSFTEYPDKIYPIYCPGWTVMYSPDVVFELYLNAQHTPYFWIDDVHITGTLAEKSHVTHTNIDSLVISKSDLQNVVEYGYNVSKPFLYGRSNLSEKEILGLWNLVKTLRPVKSMLRREEGR